MARARQKQTKAEAPPGPDIETGAGKQRVVYSAFFGPRNEEISTFINVLPNCELAENEHLLSPPVQ
jgi:hypothetical protein